MIKPTARNTLACYFVVTVIIWTTAWWIQLYLLDNSKEF